ncbi:Alkaline phosphatase precursor [Stieleria bergensis]|uniref:Alkaline phosphatase n=1 Tax=Stieleria bergensis TaxID=2528025 RepID=A0A517SUQ9_9BACT|nr:Alkaline phosphatase precursor [Planctomycetes bacterium SV_7m_r]
MNRVCLKPSAVAFFVIAAALVACPLSLQAHDRHEKPQTNFQGMVVEPTLPAATDVPDRILASWKQDPATSFAVTWRSKAGPDAVAEIAVATSGPSFLQTIERATGTTTPLQTSQGTVHMHAAEFTDLQPNTLYTYRVGSRRTQKLDPRSAAKQHKDSADYAWSEWFQFKTAKTFEGQVKPLQFVYVGDAQNDVKSLWSRLIRESYRDLPRMTFMLHAGDLVNHGNEDHEWGQWFHAGGFIFPTIPQLAVPGNHEYDRDGFHETDKTARRLSRRWAQRFEFPGNGPEGFQENVYYVDVQGVRIIGLDSQSPDKESQTKWLESVLANNPNRWTIVTHHHPIYSTSRGRDNAQLRTLWQPLYEKHGVDLVLQGHDHTYGRTAPIRSAIQQKSDTQSNVATGLRVAESDGGPVYVVSVSGPKMYPLKKYPDDADPFETQIGGTQLYQVIQIDHDRISYQAKTPNGTVADAFELHKDEAGKTTFTDKSAEVTK